MAIPVFIFNFIYNFEIVRPNMFNVFNQIGIWFKVQVI